MPKILLGDSFIYFKRQKPAKANEQTNTVQKNQGLPKHFSHSQTCCLIKMLLFYIFH